MEVNKGKWFSFYFSLWEHFWNCFLFFSVKPSFVHRPRCHSYVLLLACSGCPYDLQIREVRDDSLVLLWASPLYEGQSPVIGYLLEISQGEQSDNWMALTEKPICDTHFKVSDAVKRPSQQITYSQIYNLGAFNASASKSTSLTETRSAPVSHSLVFLIWASMFKRSLYIMTWCGKCFMCFLWLPGVRPSGGSDVPPACVGCQWGWSRGSVTAHWASHGSNSSRLFTKAAERRCNKKITSEASGYKIWDILFY